MSTTDPFTDHPDHAYHDLRVARVIDETVDARSIVLEIPAALERAFRYKSGQFLTLKIPYEGKDLIRCYSLASCPHTESEHKVTVKRVDDGRISNWINDNLAIGEVVKVLPPGGLFTLGEGDHPVLLFGGGSGITPVISIIKTALAVTGRRVKLVYANRDRASIIFKDELDQLASAHPGRLEIVHSLDDAQGFVDVARVNAYAEGWLDAECYVCGPGSFMDVVERALAAAGIAAERIHSEKFVSPPDPGQAAQAFADQAAQVGGEIPDSITVALDGEVRDVPYEKGQTVLVATQQAGLEPPFSCTDGFCGCCMARLEAGKVEMLNNDFLSAKEVADGWVLTCQSVPTTRECKIKYPD
ncbi:MAG: ferredoxin--NADP reductase [Myxococcales bacterium]|jgi:3-ketosteroid 9alpha-monooxygenase subunit B|nr:MAG: ferredoxin--NADP reductase [Myxococcales bacterium]